MSKQPKGQLRADFEMNLSDRRYWFGSYIIWLKIPMNLSDHRRVQMPLNFTKLRYQAFTRMTPMGYRRMKTPDVVHDRDNQEIT